MLVKNFFLIFIKIMELCSKVKHRIVIITSYINVMLNVVAIFPSMFNFTHNPNIDEIISALEEVVTTLSN